MFLNKFLLIGGGFAVAGTGTGLGIYYATNGTGNRESGPVEERGEQVGAPQAQSVGGSSSVSGRSDHLDASSVGTK